MILRDKRKVVFIIPPYNISRTIYALPEDYQTGVSNLQVYPFLGIFQLASILRNMDYDVEIYDCTAEGIKVDQVSTISLKCSPVFIGIYVNSFVLRAAKEIIERIRRISKVPIVLGGPHITALPESLLDLGGDYGVCGDGEDGIVEIAECLSRNISPVSNKGIFSAQDIILKKTIYPYILREIDTIPPPYRPEKFRKIYYSPFFRSPITTMIASRGCPYRCIYCMSGSFGGYRIRKLESVLGEIEEIIHSGYHTIQFQDDVFNINRKWLLDFCDQMKGRGLNKRVSWDCNLRADLCDESTFKAISEAGCKMVRFGIESFNDDSRMQILKKSLSMVEIRKSIISAKKYGLRTLGYLMLGIPGEPEIGIDDYLRFIRELDLDYIDLKLSIILPGTELFKIALEKKVIKEDIWQSLIYNGGDLPVFVENPSEIYNLRKKQRSIIHNFYFNNRLIIREFIGSIVDRRLSSTIKAFFNLLRYRR